MLHRVLPDVSLRIVPGDSYLFVAMSIFDVVYNRVSLRRVANKGGRLCLYCFDTWEPEYDHWEGLFSHHPGHCPLLRGHGRQNPYYRLQARAGVQ